MLTARRYLFGVAAAVLVAGALPSPRLGAAPILVPDPTQVVVIVNRDSNDISFMDIKSRKIVGKAFLGNNVNPHMAMMSPDGRYVVTGGSRANKAYIIDARTLQLVKVIPMAIPSRSSTWSRSPRSRPFPASSNR
jgi:DNA-binding beta-propeller fold protein YncE